MGADIWQKAAEIDREVIALAAVKAPDTPECLFAKRRNFPS